MIRSWFPLWFRDCGYFVLVLSMVFRGEIAVACIKLWLRVKRGWEERNRKTQLAAETMAHQQEDRGT